MLASTLSEESVEEFEELEEELEEEIEEDSKDAVLPDDAHTAPDERGDSMRTSTPTELPSGRTPPEM